MHTVEIHQTMAIEASELFDHIYGTPYQKILILPLLYDDELFLWYGWPRKGLISSRDHCQRSSSSRIPDSPRAGFEPVQNLSLGFVEWSCAVVIFKDFDYLYLKILSKIDLGLNVNASCTSKKSHCLQKTTKLWYKN